MTVVRGPLGPEAEIEVMQFLAERLARPVSLDVWTRGHSELTRLDRDPCEHCEDQLTLVRQLVRLTPLLSVTPYDLDRHADRAAQSGVDLAPTTTVRSGGRSVQFVGMAGGMLFPAFLDILTYLSIGQTPLEDPTRAALAMLSAPVALGVLVAPYDNYSAHLARLASALAAECRFIRLRIVDATEYPMFASLRAIEGVPLLSIAGEHFMGAWDESELVEQILRIVTGNTEPVPRSQVYAVPFITEADARRLQSETVEQVSSTPSSGLYVPGRD